MKDKEVKNKAAKGREHHLMLSLVTRACRGAEMKTLLAVSCN